MATTFRQVWSYLLGVIPELSGPHAQVLVNLAWEDIRDSNQLWSFLLVFHHITIPAAISAGSVTVTQDSANVLADATAKAVLDPVVLDLANRFFRISAAGPIYGISSYSTITGILVLDRPFQEDSGSFGYQVYQPYFQVPVADFRQWETFIDPVLNRPIFLHWTKDEIDARDPQRASQGDPFIVVAHRHHQTTGYPVFELWPGPVNRRSYEVTFVRRGTDISDAIPPPDGFKALLLDRALYRGYEWAEANKTRFPKTLAEVNWPFLMGKVNKSYLDRLKDVTSADRQIYNRQWANSKFVRSGMNVLDVDLLQISDPYLLVR